VPPGSRVLDLGCGPGLVAKELLARGCTVVGLDRLPPPAGHVSEFVQWDLDDLDLPVDVDAFDVILMLDIIEHLKAPERFVDMLRQRSRQARPRIVITTGNVTFLLPRLMFALGQFNYHTAGILDFTHTRLFTFYSMRRMLEESGYEILVERGIPAPYAKALDGELGRRLVAWNERALAVRPSVLAYQMYFEVRPLPTVETLLDAAVVHSERRGGR
jgi:SAM-dependent methyltransferase